MPGYKSPQVTTYMFSSLSSILYEVSIVAQHNNISIVDGVHISCLMPILYPSFLVKFNVQAYC